MSDWHLAARFAVAIGLGLLLGLERERTHEVGGRWGGVRTFAVITLLGATSAFLHQEFGLALVGAVAFLALAALIVASYVRTSAKGDVGLTTEVSGLLAFIVGVLCGFGYIGLASALTVANLLLLALKDWLHKFAHKVEAPDVEATLKFAIITLIVLPLLPDRNFGPPPLDVFNPYKVWLMVVLIAGLNFVGYVLVKVVGSEQALALAGLLGGLVSSTAATLGFAERSRREPDQSQSLALAILLAWTVMLVRIAVILAVVNPDVFGETFASLAAITAASLVLCGIYWRRGRSANKGSVATRGNPFELGQAVKFGLLYGVIIFVARAAQVYLGEGGLYLAGAVGGISDLDAIALSVANLAQRDPTVTAAAAVTVVIAILSNTLTKTGIVVALGAPALRRAILPAAAVVFVVGIVAIVLAG